MMSGWTPSGCNDAKELSYVRALERTSKKLIVLSFSTSITLRFTKKYAVLYIENFIEMFSAKRNTQVFKRSVLNGYNTIN